MSKVPALKKKAADLEKKSPEKAIPVYVELLAEMEKEPGELDVALFNRVGDLMAKAGNVAEAVDYYEKAVDHYTEGGFFNNAIALCSKILRSSPGRATVYYKLGKISAQKGFKADAKKNFLEYADRMQKAGKVDEAFRALGEFADLVPEETDVRLMLSDQMLKAGKEKEAIEHLQVLHEQFDRDGNTSEAQATAERLRAIDPSIEPRAAGQSGDGGGGGGGSKTDDLVFLDLSDTPAAQNQRLSVAKRVTSQLKPVTEPAKKTPPATPVVPPPAVKAPSPPPVMDKAPPPAVEAEAPADGGLLEIESTSLSSGDNTSAVSGGLEIESTSMAEPEAPASDGGALDLIMPDADEPAVTASADIPLMDLGEPEADTSAEPVADIPLIDADLEIATPEPRPSTIIAKKSVAVLTAAVEASPEDWAAHRELAEAMLEAGNREAGVRELEVSMLGYERANDLTAAMSVVEEIVRIDPSSVKHHQKRVEFAYRANDRPQLVEAYLALADALFRNGQVDKSRSIYQRVLELSPDDIRAQAALSTMPEPAAPAPADKKTPTGKATPPAAGRPTPVADDSFVNLGDWLREDEGPKDTRMKVEEEEPTGNEEADFADMLKKFKQGVAENVEAEDYQSHYDLGVAFKEMGLIDEAIAEFQKALRGPEKRVRTYEAIGNCFMEKGQYAMAATILGRALADKGLSDDQLVGVLYLLGRANEATGKTDEAMVYYQRVFVVDIQFQDVADRLSALENAAR
ncbi:MAG: tetratricopeptide repeat protein [Gemmatimonadota bacterium]